MLSPSIEDHANHRASEGSAVGVSMASDLLFAGAGEESVDLQTLTQTATPQ